MVAKKLLKLGLGRSAARYAGRGIVGGAIVGGAYGGMSNDTSIIGGALGGAIMGGIGGGIYGRMQKQAAPIANSLLLSGRAKNVRANYKTLKVAHKLHQPVGSTMAHSMQILRNQKKF